MLVAVHATCIKSMLVQRVLCPGHVLQGKPCNPAKSDERVAVTQYPLLLPEPQV